MTIKGNAYCCVMTLSHYTREETVQFLERNERLHGVIYDCLIPVLEVSSIKLVLEVQNIATYDP